MVWGIALASLFLAVAIVAAIMRFGAQAWNELARAHPPVEPAADAVRREFQSLQFGMFNLGWGIHLAVDDEYLHLMPAWLWRVCGGRDASVPWTAVRLMHKRKRTSMVRIGRHTLVGPAWAFGLAGKATPS